MRFLSKISFCILALLATSANIKAQLLLNEDVHLQSATFISTQRNPVTNLSDTEWLSAQLNMGKNESWKLIRTETDNIGYTHSRYQQYLGEYKIEHGIYIVHKKNNVITSANGKYFNGLSPNFSISKSFEQALATALLSINATEYAWQNTDIVAITGYKAPKNEMVILPILKNNAYEFHLCYKVDVYATVPLSRQNIYIDAASGLIINTVSLIETADEIGTAHTKYSGIRPIKTTFMDTAYVLKEISRGGGIETRNLKNGTNNASFRNAVPFFDADNNWNNINAKKDEVATDVHWGTEMVYDYYLAKHNRNSFNNNGAKLMSYVHFSTNFDNAFWNGFFMTYGDGNFFKPLVSLDVVGHEITHGVTQFTANLSSQNEPGSLNESFSDIFGNLIELFAKPEDANWKVGEDITKDSSGLRNMADPKAKFHPNTYNGQYWITNPQQDFGGIHSNCSVQNYWFYLLAVGGSGTNDNAYSYNIQPIGIDKASAIAYRNLTVYLTSASTFADARLGSLRAAVDLYGDCSPEFLTVKEAWDAVGVLGADSLVSNFSAKKQNYCLHPAKVDFKNTSTGGYTFLWNFGDGTTSTLTSPSHTYQNEGEYTVSLKIINCAGDSNISLKTNYIHINDTLICDIDMPASGHDTIPLRCRGKLYDNGGPDANYTGNTDGLTTITTDKNKVISLTFNSFRLENDCDCDYMYLYDGADKTAPQIGKYNTLTTPITINSTGSAITVRQFTDPAAEFSGFDITWQCHNAPQIVFTTDTSTICQGNISFTNTSLFSDSYLWDFGDGSTSTATSTIHTYATEGTYTISLTASNAFATRTQSIMVNYIANSGPCYIFRLPCYGCGQ